jgi:predicted HAD superfamily Cof-like phosphohydrolase
MSKTIHMQFFAPHSAQVDVEVFHRTLDIPIGRSVKIRRPKLRAELIKEESKELIHAIEHDDLYGAIDGMCDLMVVTYGTAVEWGINLAPFWDEVHRTNMAKFGGPTREDGKKLKPDGWLPPDLKKVMKDNTGG